MDRANQSAFQALLPSGRLRTNLLVTATFLLGLPPLRCELPKKHRKFESVGLLFLQCRPPQSKFPEQVESSLGWCKPGTNHPLCPTTGGHPGVLSSEREQPLNHSIHTTKRMFPPLRGRTHQDIGRLSHGSTVQPF